MHALSTTELLTVWELGLVQTPVQWALTVLATAEPETSPEALANLTISQRDGRLFTLREWIFGPHLESLATCPSCGERLELTFDLTDIRSADPGQPIGPLSLSWAGYEVCFRLPDSLDLMAVANQGDTAWQRQMLIKRCLLSAAQTSEDIAIEQLPAEILDQVVARMGEADPEADVQLSLICPACGHKWQAIFDIVSFFWAELDTWAYHMCHEVHQLASAYGWREADILAMSAQRRQLYLTLINR